jgi:hypothetical protein
MRKYLALALLVTFSWIGQDARAGVTLDVVFQDGTGNALTITEGDEGPGCAFGGYYDGSATTGYCMNVVLKMTEDLWQGSVDVSVSYDTDNGLAVASMREWVGLLIPTKGMQPEICNPVDGLADNGGILQSFDCIAPSPPAEFPLFAATYRIGTVVWDTSAVIAGGDGMAVISAVFASGDGVSQVINGNVVDISEQVVLGNAVLNIIAGAAPVPSVGPTGRALVGMAVLGIGIVGLVIAARRRSR